MLAFENDCLVPFMTSQLDGGRWVNVVSASLPCAFWILATNVGIPRYKQPSIVKIHEGPETNEYKWHKIHKTDFFSGFVDYSPPKKKSKICFHLGHVYSFLMSFLHLSSYPSPNHFWDQPAFFFQRATAATESPPLLGLMLIFESHICSAFRSLRICILHGEASVKSPQKILQWPYMFTDDV